MPTATPSQIDRAAGQLIAEGVAVLENALTPAQLSAAKTGVAWAMDTRDGHKFIKARTYEWHREHPVFVDLLEHPAVMHICDRLLGAERHIIAAQCSRNVKAGFYAPGADRLHNDGVFFPTPDRLVPGVPLDRYSFSAMWYVQDTPMEMGPTQFIPGSHLETDKKYEESDVSGLVRDRRWFSRPIPAGSLVLFNHRTWHRGQPNQTDLPRDLITNAYALPAVDKVQVLTPQADGSQRYMECAELMRVASPTVVSLLRARG